VGCKQKLGRLSDATTAVNGYGSPLSRGRLVEVISSFLLPPFDFRLPTPDKAP